MLCKFLSQAFDDNNGVYPLAYVVVETETLDSWTWFLSHLGDDLGLTTISNFTFMTDRQRYFQFHLMKGNKVSRAYKTVTSTKCNNTSHNARTCKGKRPNDGNDGGKAKGKERDKTKGKDKGKTKRQWKGTI